MARLTIKKYKNNNSKNNAYGKTYGRLVHQDTMNTSDLCRHMMKHGTFYLSANTEGLCVREFDFSLLFLKLFVKNEHLMHRR